jgi:hypothetical protein
MSKRVIESAAQMWLRLVFDFEGKAAVKECLNQPGVYVLFRDDEPYYVGQTKRAPLFKRLKNHATNTRGRYYHFWNYFSAFIISDAKHRDEVEGILIASMPIANGATPKIKRIPLPRIVAKKMRSIRISGAAQDE